MNNADVAAVLSEIAELLELKDESSFRIRAYENAAKILDGLTADVRVLNDQKELTKVKGIGKGIAQTVEELLATGHVAMLDGLRDDFPPGVRSFMGVPGIGPSLARRVYRELGVESLEDLRTAAEDGRIAGLSGLGEKSAQNVLRGLQRVNKRDSRISIGKALPVVEELIAQLDEYPFIDKLTPAGSLRRWSPTIGDIDLMATSTEPERVMELFVALPQVAHVLAHGKTKASVLTDNGLQVDLRIVEAAHWGSLVQHFTGSRDHNVELRDYALRMGKSLNEYGIASVKSGERAEFPDEESFYAALDLQYIPPELRQGAGEIAKARSNRLPKLVQIGDIRGDLHCHTEWSDGSLPIEQMIQVARQRGYDYVAITDHSGGIGVAGGLSSDRLREQIQAVREIDSRYSDFDVFTGTELEIKRDGSLDFPDALLAELDWVVASVHSGFNQSLAEMTARIIRAMENPHVNAIGHPTGRLIGKREPYAIDLDRVFQAAARTGTALEINSFPERLDLTDSHVRRALEAGARVVIDTDAHAPAHFDNIRYGVAMARRGWATAGDVVNCASGAQLREALRNA